MNEIISKVTPLTRGLIWVSKGEDRSSSTYLALDYLLNGLLTASLKANSDFSSRLILSSNFGFPLHVFCMNKFVQREFDSFLKLVKKDMKEGNMILVIDEAETFPSLVKSTPKEMQSSLHLLK